MKESLKAGLKHSFAYTVPETKTVPSIFPESPEFQAMPQVFATGFMVALVEWTCVQLIGSHLDRGEGSLGTGVNLSHVAPTPPGFTVTVDAELTEVNGRRLTFKVKAHDGAELIGEGWHERTVVEWDRFNKRVSEKARAAQKG